MQREFSSCALLLACLSAGSLTAADAEAGPLPWIEGSTTLVLLPDTQWYTKSHPQFFEAQTKWIAANRARYRIAYRADGGEWRECSTSAVTGAVAHDGAARRRSRRGYQMNSVCPGMAMARMGKSMSHVRLSGTSFNWEFSACSQVSSFPV